MKKKKRECSKCHKKLKEGESYIGIQVDWNPFESTYDMLTKHHVWKYTHTECPKAVS